MKRLTFKKTYLLFKADFSSNMLSLQRFISSTISCLRYKLHKSRDAKIKYDGLVDAKVTLLFSPYLYTSHCQYEDMLNL